MKNLTVSLDEGVYRLARIRAAERDTSVSALVRDFLIALAAQESEAEGLKREEARLRDSIAGFRAADRLGRDDVHHRIP